MSELRKGYRGLSADDKLVVRDRVSDNFSELLYFFQSGWSQGLDEQVALVKELYEEKEKALKLLKRKAHDERSNAEGKLTRTAPVEAEALSTKTVNERRSSS